MPEAEQLGISELTQDGNKSEYITRLGDLTGRDANADIVVGGKTLKFVPNINFSKWNDEAWVNLNYEAVTVQSEKETLNKGKVSLAVGDIKTDFWVLNPKVLEMAISFDKKLLKNEIKLKIQSSNNLSFHYQTPDPDVIIDDDYRFPDNVIGSYAIYIDKSNNEYKTGKFAHWYRWEVIDNDGKKEWCDPLKIENGYLIIGLPSKFMSTAKYPVIAQGAGDTFGQSSQGGSADSESDAEDFILGNQPAVGPAEDGTGNSIHAYIVTSTANKNWAGALYEADKSNVIANGSTEEITITAGTDGEISADFEGTKPTVLAASTYFIVGWCASEAGNARYYKDDVGSAGLRDFDAYDLNWMEPWVPVTRNYRHSIWCDYTPEAAPAAEEDYYAPHGHINAGHINGGHIG